MSRHPADEEPPDGALIRFGFRFPCSGDKEFSGIYRAGRGIYSTGVTLKTRRWLKLSRWGSPRMIWWEEAR